MNNMENTKPIVIAIPSFERAECCFHNTFRLLVQLQNTFPVYIFVTNDAEHTRYKNMIRLMTNFEYKFIVTNTIGLAQKRNFITNYFEDGQWIVQMDDDIEQISRMIDSKSKVALNEFSNFVEKMFKICLEHKTRLWGVYPLANPYFMNEYVWVGRCYVVGAFFGIINDIEIQISNCLQEDKERSLLFVEKYGKIVRCNFVGIQTKYWKNQGGMQSDFQLPKEIRNLANIEMSILELHRRFPNQISKKKNKNNYPDVRIKNQIIIKTKCN